MSIPLFPPSLTPQSSTKSTVAPYLPPCSENKEARGLADPSIFYTKKLPTVPSTDITTPLSPLQYTLYNKLHQLIASDDENVLTILNEHIQRQEVDLNFQHEHVYNSCTLLMHACYRQNLQLVLYLLSFNNLIELNMQNFFTQDTALFYVIIHCPVFTETTVHIVRELIQHGADPNIINNTEFPVLFLMMRRSCEFINDYFIDIVATLLHSTIPIKLCIHTKHIMFCTPLRFLLPNRYQSQRSPLFLDLLVMLLEHRHDEREAKRPIFKDIIERIRNDIKLVHGMINNFPNGQRVNFPSPDENFAYDQYLVLSIPELDLSYTPYQSFYAPVFGVLHPQPSREALQLLLSHMPDTKIRSLLGTNRSNIIYTLFQYVEVLDEEVYSVVKYLNDRHNKDCKNEKKTTLFKTIIGTEFIEKNHPRDIVGPKLLPLHPLPLLSPTQSTTATGAIIAQPVPSVPHSNRQASALLTRLNSLGTSKYGGEKATTLKKTELDSVPSYERHTEAMAKQLTTLYTNLSNFNSEFLCDPHESVLSSILFQDRIPTPLETMATTFFTQYPQFLQQAIAQSTPNSSLLSAASATLSDSTTHGQPIATTDHLSSIIRVYEHQNLSPLIVGDFHPYLIHGEKRETWPINGQSVITVHLISALFFNNRWRWSQKFFELCDLITGGSNDRIYKYLHLVLCSPNPDYSIFYRLARHKRENPGISSKDEEAGLPIIERGLLWLFSNPNIDAPDRKAIGLDSLNAINTYQHNYTHHLNTNGLPIPTSSAIPLGISPYSGDHHGSNFPQYAQPQYQTSSGPFIVPPSSMPQLPQQNAHVPQDFIHAYSAGRIGVYTHQQRIQVIQRLTQPTKTEFHQLDIYGDNNIIQLTEFLIKHFSARANYTVRVNGRTMSCLSCILGNSAISFQVACALFNKIISPRYASATNTYIPPSVMLYWSDGTPALPKRKELPKPDQRLIPIEMAIYEAIEWFIANGSQSVSYLNFIALIWVLIKLRGVKIQDIRRNSSHYDVGREMMDLTRQSQEDRFKGVSRRGTVTQKDGRRGTILKDESGRRGTILKDEGGRRGTVTAQQGPSAGGRRGTIGGGAAPGVGRRGTILGGRGDVADPSIPQCENWSLMSLLIAFGNYDAIGVFELYGYLQQLGNVLQPTPFMRDYLTNTYPDGFGATYVNHLSQSEPCVDLFKFICHNRNAAFAFPNFCTVFGQFILRRILFLSQFIVITEEHHPHIILYNRILTEQREQYITQRLQKNSERDQPGGEDYDDEDYDEDGYYDEDDDEDDDYDLGDYDYGGGTTKTSPPNALRGRTMDGPDHDRDFPRVTVRQSERQTHLLLNLSDSSPQSLTQQWVKPQLASNYYGPTYTSMEERYSKDGMFPFTEITLPLFFQSIVSISNPNRPSQYFTIQFLLIYFYPQLKHILVSPLPPIYISSSAVYSHETHAVRQTGVKQPPQRGFRAHRPSQTEFDGPVRSATPSHSSGSYPVVAVNENGNTLRALSEDSPNANCSDVDSMRDSGPAANTSPINGGDEVEQYGARGRSGTVLPGGKRERSQSRGRGGGQQSNSAAQEHQINVTSIFVTPVLYDFYTTLTFLFLDEYTATYTHQAIQHTNIVPPRSSRWQHDCQTLCEYHAILKHSYKTHSPSSTYFRSPILCFIAMVQYQPITSTYMFLLEYLLRRYYMRLHTHLSIEATRSVVIPICTTINISPLFLLIYYLSLNRSLNQFAPTLYQARHHQASQNISFYVPTTNHDLDMLYSSSLNPVPIINLTNTQPNIYVKYNRNFPYIAQSPMLIGPNTIIPPHDNTLYTSQLFHTVCQFETDYGRWINPIDPAHLRTMYKDRPEWLHTGGRYNYTTTISYPTNMLAFLFHKWVEFFFCSGGTLTSLHTHITNALLQHGHCPNLSVHDDDDYGNFSEAVPTPLHALLDVPFMSGQLYTKATPDLVSLFLNHPHFDKEIGCLAEPLLFLPIRSFNSPNPHRVEVLKRIIRSNVNLLRVDLARSATVLTEALQKAIGFFNSGAAPTPSGFQIVAQLLASGVTPVTAFNSEDHHFTNQYVAFTGGNLPKFANYSQHNYPQGWSLSSLVHFYASHYLLPNNIAPNAVLALALHPNIQVKQLLFGVTDWKAEVQPSAAEKKWFASYFENPRHFGAALQTNTQASNVVGHEALPLTVASAWFTPGFVNILMELSHDFINKYKDMSLAQFISLRQKDLQLKSQSAPANQKIDYNISDLLVLMDYQREHIKLPSWMAITTQCKQDNKAMYPDDWRKCLSERAPFFQIHRVDMFSVFPSIQLRERDHTVYKGLIWYLSDTTGQLTADDMSTLLSITKKSLSPSCLDILTLTPTEIKAKISDTVQFTSKTTTSSSASSNQLLIAAEEQFGSIASIGLNNSHSNGTRDDTAPIDNLDDYLIDDPQSPTPKQPARIIVEARDEGVENKNSPTEHDIPINIDNDTAFVKVAENDTIAPSSGDPKTLKVEKPEELSLCRRIFDISLLSDCDSIIDCTTRNFFFENLVHIAILRRWPVDAIKMLYLEVAYQFSIKYQDIYYRAHLPQPEQIRLENEIIATIDGIHSSPPISSCSSSSSTFLKLIQPNIGPDFTTKNTILSLRKQYEETNGQTPTKFMLDYIQLFHDSIGLSPLHYFQITSYDLDPSVYYDQILNNKYSAQYVSTHHLKFTRYGEYQQSLRVIQDINHFYVQQQNIAMTAGLSDQNVNELLISSMSYNSGSNLQLEARLSGSNHSPFMLLNGFSTTDSNNDSRSSFSFQLPPAHQAFLELTRANNPSPRNGLENCVTTVAISEEPEVGKLTIEALHNHSSERINDNNASFISSVSYGPSFPEYLVNSYKPNHMVTKDIMIELSTMPFLRSLQLLLSYDFNIIRPIPGTTKNVLKDPLLFINPQNAIIASTTLYKLFKEKLFLPFYALPFINLNMLYQGHPWIHMYDYNLHIKSCEAVLKAQIDYTIDYSDEDFSAYRNILATIMSSTPSDFSPPVGKSDNLKRLKFGLPTSPTLANPPGNSPSTFVTANNTPLSPKPHGKTFGKLKIEELSTEASLQSVATRDKTAAKGSFSDHAASGREDSTEDSHSSVEPNLYFLINNPENSSKIPTGLSPLSEDLPNPAIPNNGTNPNRHDGKGMVSPSQLTFTTADFDDYIPEQKHLPALTQSQALSLKDGSKYMTMRPNAHLMSSISASKNSLIQIRANSVVDSIQPKQSEESPLYDHDSYLIKDYMNLLVYLKLSENMLYQKMANNIIHNNTCHAKIALNVQQAPHQFLMRNVQAHLYYTSLSPNEQLSVPITIVSDEINSPVDLTIETKDHLDELPPPTEILVRRLSHPTSHYIFFRRADEKTKNNLNLTPLASIPISRQVLTLHTSFTTPLTYWRYALLRYSYTMQILKAVPIRLPTWSLLAKATYYYDYFVTRSGTYRTMGPLPIAQFYCIDILRIPTWAQTEENTRTNPVALTATAPIAIASVSASTNPSHHTNDPATATPSTPSKQQKNDKLKSKIELQHTIDPSPTNHKSKGSNSSKDQGKLDGPTEPNQTASSGCCEVM